jgi:hypothetical protein
MLYFALSMSSTVLISQQVVSDGVYTGVFKKKYREFNSTVLWENFEEGHVT